MNVRRSWRGKFVMELLVLVQQVRCQVSAELVRFELRPGTLSLEKGVQWDRPEDWQDECKTCTMLNACLLRY